MADPLKYPKKWNSQHLVFCMKDFVQTCGRGKELGMILAANCYAHRSWKDFYFVANAMCQVSQLYSFLKQG